MSIFWLYRNKEGGGRRADRVYYCIDCMLSSISCLLRKKTSRNTTRLLLFDFLYIYILMSTGIQGGAGSTSPWVWGECDPAIGRREVGGQTRTAAQSHPANFALKCPRCRTSGQVGGRPLQSCPRRNTQRRIDEPDWTQEEPVVAMLEPRGLSPFSLPPSPVYTAHITWIHFTLALFLFCFFFCSFIYATSISMTARLLLLHLSPPVGLFWTHKNKKDYAVKPPTPLYVCVVRIFYFSVFSTAGED